MAAMMVAFTSLKAQEVTITIMPGWNWISVPLMDTLDFETALGSFTPVNGDIIKSQWSNACYMNGQWRGQISQFYPGYGYMYKSNRVMPATVTFHAQQPVPQVVVTTSEPMLITAVSAMCGGEVNTCDGNYVAIQFRGICWGVNSNPTLNDNYLELEGGIGSFTASMTNLNLNTTYYVRAYAVTANGTYYGEQKTFTTRDGIPTLTMVEVTNIQGTCATCSGAFTDNGGLAVSAIGVCWSTSPNPTIADSHTTNNNWWSGSFTNTITDLSVNTTYYVRAYATTAVGTGYGEQGSFITLDGIPTLITEDITNITGESAICGGTITNNEGLDILVRGVCWSTLQNPTIADEHTTDGNGIGNFSSNITGLNVSTTYYVRAYATTDAGTGYGEQQSFITLNGIPTLTTADITDITGSTATCGGDITDNGGLDVIARGVCWSTSTAPTITDFHTTDGYGTGSFNSSITDLILGTTYYVRSYATTNAGTSYGNEMSFTTRDGILSLTTADVSNIGSGWATCGGNIIDDGGLNIIARGVCWGTSPNPTTSDNHTNNGTGTGSFSSNLLCLNASTTYYVRAYANNSLGTTYGNELSFTTTPLPMGAIDGIFSISDTSQVYFSQGNLQYQASTNTWRFAENQYDYIGEANGNISQTYENWIDMFGWGTSGRNFGNTYYHPWDSNNFDGSLYSPPGQYNLTGFYANADWGVLNPINNGGNASNQWRTMTKSEWNYVFYARSTSSGIRFAKANVNNTKGVILLPDEWIIDTYSLSNTNNREASFNSNIIIATQWTVLENSGAVFFPAAGSRNGTSVYNVDYSGTYWTSTCYYNIGAYYVNFNNSSLNTDYNGYRYYGRCVRLVRNAE